MSKMIEGEGVMKYEIRLKREESVRLYDKDKILVIKPLSYEASCLYGRKTKWCTAAANTRRHWSSHTSKGIVFYIVINNNLEETDDLYKVLAEVSPDGQILWWDAQDKQIKKPNFIEEKG